MKKFLLLTMIILSLFLVPVVVASRPNISISNLSGVPDPVVNGTSINFTINITNYNNVTAGTPDDAGNDAYNVTIIINGTINMTNVTTSITANFSEGPGGLIFIIYVIPNGTSFSFTVNYTVEANATDTLTTHLNVTNYTNTSVMDGNNFVFNDGAGSLNVTNATTVTVETRRPNITIVKSNTSGFTNVVNGTSVNFSINVTNVGNMTAYNVTVVDNATDLINSAGNLTFSNASIVANDTTNTTWIIYSIEPGTSFTFSINFTVGTSAAGVINNTVNLTNYTDGAFGNLNPGGIAVFTNGPTNGSNSTTTANVIVETRRPNITITKSDEFDRVLAGQVVNYTINVSNIGNGTAYNVTVIENFTNQAVFTFDSATIVANDSANSTWIIYQINAGSSFVFSINLTTSSQTGDVLNFVNVTNYTDNDDSNLNPGSITIFSAHGNVTNATETTTIWGVASPSQSGTGGSSSGSGPGRAIKIHAVGEDAIALVIWKADTTYLRMMDLDFLIAVTRIGRDGASFSVAGVPLVMDVGQTEDVDLDGDGWSDLSVTLTNVLFNRIMVNMQTLATPAIPSVPALAPIVRAVPEESSPVVDSVLDVPAEESVLAEEPVESPPRSNKRLVSAVIIAIILLGVIGYGLLQGPLKPWMQKFSKEKTMVWARKK